MSDQKTHWLLTYVTQNGDSFRESTRAAGMDPATEADVKEGLAAVIAERARTPLPTIYVRDQTRGGSPVLVFLGRMSHVELERDLPGEADPDPEDRADLTEEAERHLELVREGPTEADLGELRPQGVHPRLQRDLFSNLVPAGPHRFA